MDRTRLLIKLKRYHYGQKNAVSSKELEIAFFVSGKKIRDAVNALRQDGEPICSVLDVPPTLSYLFPQSHPLMTSTKPCGIGASRMPSASTTRKRS